MSKVYLNPNLDPEQYYRNIKAYSLLYDQVCIWSPSVEQLESSGFAEKDFLTLCDPDPIHESLPILVPVAREGWHDNASSRVEGKFRQELRRIAEKYESPIVPRDDYEIGYISTNSIYNPELDKELCDLIPQNESHLEKMNDVAIKNHKPLEWAVLNTYSQDLLACARVGSNSPITTQKLIRGFQYFVESEDKAQSKIFFEFEPETRLSVPAIQIANLNVERMDAGQIIQFRHDHKTGANRIFDDVIFQHVSQSNDMDVEKIVKELLKGHVTQANYYMWALATTLAGVSNQIPLQISPFVAMSLIVAAGTFRGDLTRVIAEALNFRSPYRRLLMRTNTAADVFVEVTGTVRKKDQTLNDQS